MNRDECHTYDDVVCTVCGCVCDDLSLRVRGQRIEQVTNGCPLADPWFAQLNRPQPPVAQIAGRAVPLEEALEASAELLSRSRAPLIFGLSRSSTPGQRAAVRLADQLRATIDTTASVCHGPSIMAIQQVGESTCSLGEVRHRADLVLFWGADPAVTHPRHFERYSVDAPGMFLPGGRQDRTVVVIDAKPTRTSDLADHFIQVPAGTDFELIWALRQTIRQPTGSELPAAPIAADALRELARMVTSCRYGAVFFGLGLAQHGIGHANVEALLRLVAELNAHTRFTARRLRIPGDVTGADCVLCWQTGFPFAVNLSRGYPRYNPGEYSANELLERREVDLCLLVGSEMVPRLSDGARRHLRSIPTILLEYPHLDPRLDCSIQFTSAVYGIHAAGTAYRMDEIPLPLRPLLPTTLPTDEALLKEMAVRSGRKIASAEPARTWWHGFGQAVSHRLPTTGQQYGSCVTELRPWLALSAERRVLVVLDRNAIAGSHVPEQLEKVLAEYHVAYFDRIEPNPSLELAESVATLAREHRADRMIAIGGGSGLDLAKLAALGARDASWSERLRASQPLDNLSPLPLAAVPTTAGSGSEATHFAVVYLGMQKRSVVHLGLRPEWVILDPSLAARMPASLAAVTGLDALAQAIESFWAVHSTDESRSDAQLALSIIAPRLVRSTRAPAWNDRAAMLLGAHLAGQAIRSGQTTAAHALSYALTKQFGIPHGLAVALTLGHVGAWNAECTASDCQDPRGYAWVHRQVRTVSSLLDISPEQFPHRIAKWLRELKLPSTLSEAGVDRTRIPELAASVDPVRLSNNPRRLTADSLPALLRRAT